MRSSLSGVDRSDSNEKSMLLPGCRFSVVVLVCAFVASAATEAKVWQVSTAESFRDALGHAKSGDQILLAPGIYHGAFHGRGLRDVTIRSIDAGRLAVIDATDAGEGLKLSSATRVKIASLIIENASANGISIDDDGFKQFSMQIVLRDILVRNGGGHAIKFAGVDGFLIDSVTLQDWGNGHAGFNLLGVHNGIVQHSLVRRTDTVGGFGLKVEGGSTNIAIRANRFEDAGERAIQFGGSVRLNPFRARTADGVAAENVSAEGNVIVSRGADAAGIRAAVAFVGARDARFHHNLVFRPGVFVGRVLNEGIHPAVGDARNRIFRNNVILWYDGDFANGTPFNVGPSTFPESLKFRKNRWANLSPHASSDVLLPSGNHAPSSGVDPGVRPDGPIAWEFHWGLWIVNATPYPQSYRLESQRMKIATPGARSKFGPTLANPFVGDWEFAEVSSDELALPAMSSRIMVSQSENQLPASAD